MEQPTPLIGTRRVNFIFFQKGVHTWAVSLPGIRMSKAGTAPVMAPGLMQREDYLTIRQRAV